MNKFMLEVTIKNALVMAIFMLILVPLMKADLAAMKIDDKGAILSMLGFLMAGTIVAAFELSYSKTNTLSGAQRWLAHATKFLLFLGIGCLIYIAMWTIHLGSHPNLWSLGFPSMCIFVALFMHDFWDALSAANANPHKE
jgi:hypothetical protein